MATPLWKVEIRFDGVSWIDVSGYALLPQGINIQRGRDSETGDAVPVGTCSFTLENNDGRFTPDRSASPYYPYVVEGVAVRVSVYANGSYRVRFYGTVQSWATSWTNETGLHAQTAVTANDTLGDLPDYTLHQASDEVVWLDHPYHYWPLRDTEAKAAAGGVDLVANSGTGWGTGGILPMDEGDQQHPLFTGSGTGLTLRTNALNVAPPYRILLVIMDDPGANCTILSGLPGGRSIKYVVGDGFDIYPENPGETDPGDYPCLLVLKVTATTVAFGVIDSTGYTMRAPFSLTLGTLRGLTLNPTLSGGASWGAGHLAVTAASGPYDEGNLARLILGTRAPYTTLYATDAGALLMTFATGRIGDGTTVSGAVLPPLEGRDVAEVTGTIATGMGARLRDNLAGAAEWIAFPPSTTPVALPSGDIDPSMMWQTDSASAYTDATVTFPDGTSYTASRSARKKRTTSFEAVHASRAGDTSMADWLVYSPTPARFPRAPYDLMTLSEAQRQTLCSVTVGSRVSISGLPSQMPGSTVVSIVEGIEEAASDTEWTTTFKLSPDVYSRLFILDDATQGVLDSYILAP